MTPARWLSTPDTGPRRGVPAIDIIAGTAGIVLTTVWAGGAQADAIATTVARHCMVTRSAAMPAARLGVVPIGWIAAGQPAQLFAPDQHHELWAVQEGLDFPGTMYGVARGTSMREIMRRQAAAYGPPGSE